MTGSKAGIILSPHLGAVLSFGLASSWARLSTKKDDGCARLTFCQFSNTNRKSKSVF